MFEGKSLRPILPNDELDGPARRSLPARKPPGYWHCICFAKNRMHSTFFQKVIICMVAAFLTACLIQWGKVFIEGADDALNSGYKKDEPAIFNH